MCLNTINEVMFIVVVVVVWRGAVWTKRNSFDFHFKNDQTGRVCVQVVEQCHHFFFFCSPLFQHPLTVLVILLNYEYFQLTTTIQHLSYDALCLKIAPTNTLLSSHFSLVFFVHYPLPPLRSSVHFFFQRD